MQTSACLCICVCMLYIYVKAAFDLIKSRLEKVKSGLDIVFVCLCLSVWQALALCLSLVALTFPCIQEPVEKVKNCLDVAFVCLRLFVQLVLPFCLYPVASIYSSSLVSSASGCASALGLSCVCRVLAVSQHWFVVFCHALPQSCVILSCLVLSCLVLSQEIN